MRAWLVIAILWFVSCAASLSRAQTPVSGQAAEKVSPQTEADGKKHVDDEGDTYNFYFQKGSAPEKVEQGTSQKIETAQDTDSGDDEGQEPVDAKAHSSKAIDESDFPLLEGHLGLIATPKTPGWGSSLGGQFNMTRKWGVQVHLLHIQTKGDTQSTFSAQGTRDFAIVETSYGGSVAIVYTPLTLGRGSAKVRVGILGGVMVLNTTQTETTNVFSARGSYDESHSADKTKGPGFVGLSVTAALQKRLGVVGYAKLATEPEYSQVGLGLALLF